MKKGKEYRLPDLRLKNGRKLKVIVTFSDDEEANKIAFENAVKIILGYPNLN